MALDLEKIDLGGFGVKKQEEESPLEEVIKPETTNQVRSNMGEAFKINPDEHAKSAQLSKDANMPVEAVKSDPAKVEQNLNLNKINFDEMSKRNPNTEKYLTDFNNSVIAQDDLDVLKSIEDIFDFSKTFENIGETIKLGFSSQAKGLEISGVDAAPDKVSELIPASAMPMGMESFAYDASVKLAEDLGIKTDEDLQAAKKEAVDSALADIREINEQVAKLAPDDLNLFEEGVRAGVESLAHMAPGFTLTLLSGGRAAPLLLTMGAQTGFGAYAEGRSEGLTPEQSAWFAAIDAAIEVGTELLPTKTLETILTGKSTKGLTREALKFMVREMGTEQLATAGQTLNRVMFDLDEELKNAGSIEEMIDIQLRRQAVTAIATVVAGGAQATAATTIRKAVEKLTQDESQKVSQGEAEQQKIDRLNEKAQESKLKERDKESFKQFVEQADGDNNTHVFIDGPQTSLYLQEKTPEEIEADPALKLLSEKVKEASETGADIEIPVGDFAAELAGTEHFDALRDSMTMSEETTAPFRQDQVKKETEAYVQSLMDEAEQNVSEYTQAQDIYTQVREQLVDTGTVTPANASIMAQVVPAWATAQAKRTGRSVEQVYQDAGLTIEGPQTGEAARLKGEVFEQPGAVYDSLSSVFETEVDATETPYTDDLGHHSLIKFDDATVQLSVREDEGNVYVTNIAAKTPDDLETQAKGTGRGTEVLSKLKEYADKTGKKLAVVGATEPAQGFYEKIPYLEREDVTLQFQGKPHTPAISYTYTPKPVARLKGEQLKDTKVVDTATGEPLTVFHGTTEKFEEFDMDQINFFTSDKTHAERFGDVKEQKLNITNPMEITQIDLESRVTEQDEIDGIPPRDYIDDVVEEAKAAGHDGVIIRDFADMDLVSDVFIPFESAQIVAPVEQRATIQEEGVVRQRRDITNSKARALFDKMNREELIAELLKHELTGIKGKRAFVIDVQDAEVIASIDADSLKWINDNMSPDHGDTLLQAVADVLEEQTDGAYHISGDEFYVLGNTVEEVQGVLDKANEKLQSAVIEATKPDGTVITLNGLNITYGIGDSKNVADQKLKQEKNRREETGERASRGEQPLGSSIRSAEGFNPEGDVSQQVGEGLTGSEFNSFISQAAESNKNAPSVDVYPAAEYDKYSIYTFDEGRVGFAIQPDGLLTSVFKHPDSTVKDALSLIVPEAIRRGATRLEAFEGFLTDNYSKYGFEEIDRVEWDEQYRPEKWTDEMGTPDILVMELNNEKFNEYSDTSTAVKIQDLRGIQRSTDQVQPGDETSGQRETQGRETDGSLSGLPREAGRFKAAVNPEIAKVAEQYMESAGLPYNPPTDFVPVDPAFASRVADAYEQMEHNPSDPEVKAAYEQLIKETAAQYQAALDAGLKVEFINFEKDGDPYAESPRMVTDDINDNNHMWVFSTRDGFGSDETFDPSENPLLQETEFEISGQKALANDLFRVVHDYFGHAKEGVGFRANGEENAFRAHSAMFSPLAQRALATETRGQNSWLNFGPHGETNRTAKTEDTVFADQKTGLLPPWASAVDDIVLEQSVSLRKEGGVETLKKYGLDPAVKHKTRDVAAALEARQREKYGKIEATDRSPEAVEKIANWMVEEVQFEMLNPDNSGVGWYSDKFQAAIDIFSKEFPELKTDKSARDTFTALIAITSDGQKVLGNFRMAEDVYRNFRETGKFTTERGTQRQGSVTINLKLIQDMYDEMGPGQMHEYLMHEMTVGELKALARKTGVEFSSSYKVDVTMPRAALVFGPKLGAFYANLMGSHGYLTMDRWWSRTFNRYRGSLLPRVTGTADKPTDTKGRKIGLAKFKEMIGQPNISDDEALSKTVAPWNAYKNRGYKNGTPIEKLANTIHKAAFDEVQDVPFNASDRSFMLESVNRAADILAEQGQETSVADIQAILWYYEKKLYGELGTRQPEGISYEEAAKQVISDRTEGSLAQSGLEQDTPIGEEIFNTETEGKIARGYYEPSNSVIRLTEASDLSTFLHEFAHFMYEMEVNGNTEMLQSINSWYKRNAEDVAKEANGYLGREFDAEKQLEQPVFHGTPHKFDTFSLDAIGTGEGAQAYGWGLYFAESRDVAEWYRDSLGRSGSYVYEGKQYTWQENWTMWAMLQELHKGNHEAAYDIVSRSLQSAQKHMKDIENRSVADYLDVIEIDPEIENKVNVKDYVKRKVSKDPHYQKLKELRDRDDKILLDFNKYDASKVEEIKGGQLYQADIPGDSEFLNHDEPMKKQPDKVKKAFDIIKKELQQDEFDVELAHEQKVKVLNEMRNLIKSHDAVTEDTEAALKEMGDSLDNKHDTVFLTARLKLMEAVGLSDGKNLETLEDALSDKKDELIELFDQTYARENIDDLNDEIYGFDLYRILTNHFRSDKKASEYLGSLGVPGLRYLDGASRGKGKGNYNYVIWDENVVTIEAVNDELIQAEQQEQPTKKVTDTENFKNWFGDSKVVDENGEPQTVYHGTDTKFDTFKTGVKSARMVLLAEFETESQGFFFSSSKEDAADYGRYVEPFYLSAQNPLTSPDQLAVSSADKESMQRSKELFEDIEYILEPAMYTHSESGRKVIDTDNGINSTFVDENGDWVSRVFYDGMIDWNLLDNPDVVSRLKERGYDSVKVAENVDESGFSWFVTAPEQIKSINAERFDPTDPRVFAQQQPPEGMEGSITEDDVVNFLDNNTSGDAIKDKAIRRAVHEQFARGFEQYLMEGKAPSIELRNAFRTFARWLARVYDSIRGVLNVKLDNEMRQVFDRLLATEEQIAAAEARAHVEPMFTDAAMAGMTEEEFAEYQKKQEKVKDIQTETLRDKIIKQLTRQTKKWWNEEKQDLIDEEMDSLSKQQVYKARARLKDGDMKLDHATVKEMMGEEKTDKRGRTFTVIPPQLRGMTAKGQEGIHPDQAAAFFGYRSGAEMMNDLVKAPPIKQQAETNAESRMVEIHGDIMTDGTIEKEADEAVRNEERGKLILSELRALAKGTTVPRVDRATIKELAITNIGKLSFRQIFPGKYRKAEIRAAEESARMLAAGNKEGAASAKMRQVMNYYLGMEATKAKNETLKIVDRMGRYNKKKVREEIQKAENGYWDQLVKILNRFEFRKTASLKEVESLNTWVKERMETDGDGLVLTNKVLDESYVTHWKNVPYSDLQGVNDSVKNIEHVARYANKLTRMQEEIDYNTLVERWTTSMDENVKTRFVSKRTDVAEGRNWGRWFMAQMTKIPVMASWLDGGERAGISHQVLVQPFTEAYNQEIKLWDKAGKPVMDAIENRSKEDIKRHNTKVYIPEIEDNLYVHQILAVALNTGNKGNLKKMLLGEGWANPEMEEEISFENEKLTAVLSHLKKQDWELVQQIWDQMEVLYPQLAEVHRRTTGLTPPKVESTPVETEFGTFRGGYYPVKYDPNRDHRAELNEDKLNAETESMFSNGASIQATVNAGATNERTGYYAPIRLSLDVVPAHFQESIHYITHHDPVREVNRLIRDKRVAKIIKEKLGPEEYAQLKPWLNDIAKDGREAPVKMFWDSMLGRLRFGVTLGVMGFKASTGIIQISGLSNSVAELGTANVMQSMRGILGSPTTMKQAWEFAVENSNVLEHRTQTMDREIKNAMKRLEGKRGIMAAVQEASMKHIALIQTYMVDLPSWHAAYIKGMKDWGDETRAFQYADWVIENVQGSGATKDMARIMRGQSETGRMFTMFMTFFSSLWNMERDLVKGAKSGRYSTTNVAAKSMFLFVVPVLFEMMMRGELGEPDDDEDARLQTMLMKVGTFPLQSVPFVRDIANASFGEYGYNITPLQAIIEQGTQTIPTIVKRGFTDEEITKGQIKGATKFIGAATGVPGVSQMWATGEHLYDVLEEGEEFTTHQLLFGPERN